MTSIPSSRNAARLAVLCLSVATLLYARQIALWGAPKNRFYTHWQRADTLMLVISLLGMVLLLYLVAMIVRRVAWGGQLLRWLTIILLADIFVGYVAAGRTGGHASVLTVAWLTLSAIGLYAASRPGSRWLDRGTTVLAALAFLAPISLIQMLLWKPWDVRATLDGKPPAPKPGNRTPVFLFVFDEWSYQRSYDGSELHPFFHNLRHLAGRSFEFTNAHSQAGSTNPSVPRIIFQREGLLQPKNGVALWAEGDSSVPSPKVPSIFTAAKARGYQTSLIGFYFPYRAVLGQQVDYIVHQAYIPKGERLARRLAQVTARNLSFLADPLSRQLWRRWNIPTVSQNWVFINREWRGFVRDLIRQSDANTFAMVHWPVPHGPWVLNEDGSYHGPFKRSRIHGSPADYQRHLAYVDLVLGEAMAELDSVGLLDRSLLIVTSDHSWKTDPDASLQKVPESRTWVPLFVKLPHQTTGHKISDRFCLGQLGVLLQRVMDTTLTQRNAPGDLTGLPSSTTCHS